MVLYINSCVRAESRTDRIARALLDKLGGNYEEIRLSEAGLQPLNAPALAHRMALLAEGQLSVPEFAPAHRFAAADTIVIAAPFWDLSFPTLLKTYFENIYITGIVSRYDENGVPEGLCRCSKLYYVTTAGGPYDPRYSYDYVKALACDCFGIKETALIKAEMLDVQGFDAERILQNTIDALDRSICIGTDASASLSGV